MKQALQFLMLLMVFVLTFENTVTGFTPVPVSNESNSSSTPVGKIILAGGWTQTNWLTSSSFFNLYSSREKVFARIWDSFNGGRMFLTSDEGTNWTQISSADTGIDILSIVMFNSKILAGTWDGFYLSTDGGTTWNAAAPAGIPSDIAIWSVVMIDTTLFAGTTGSIYKSVDYGNSWTEVNSGIPEQARITSIVAGKDAIFAGSANNGNFKTTDGGANWIEINSGLINKQIYQLTAMNNKLFAVTLAGIFQSVDDGMNWTADTNSIKHVNCLAVVNNQLLAGTDDNGIYLSSDDGVTWTSLSSEIPGSTRVWSLSVSSNDVFAGTDKGVWKLPLSEIISDIKNITGLPENFTLEQNYPNPFNPNTVIKFGLSEGAYTRLVVYDILGREVKVLMNSFLEAGYHKVEMNGSQLPSGVYIYRIEAGRYINTKKMILMK